MSKQKPKQNFLYMTPGSKVPAKKASPKKVAVTKTTAKAATKKAAASPGRNYLYMTPGSKQTAAQTAAVKKAAATKTPAKATPRNRSAANATTGMTSGGGSGANARDRTQTPGGAGRANRASSGVGSQPSRTTGTKKATGNKALSAANKFMQDVANKRGAFKATEADPAGWASIAAALGDAGDARFAAYKTGSRGTSVANAYVAGNKSRKKGPS